MPIINRDHEVNLCGRCEVEIGADGSFRVPDDYRKYCHETLYAAPQQAGSDRPHLNVWLEFLAAMFDGYGNPAWLDIDDDNQVTVPADLLADAGITPGETVYLIGNGNHMEFWSRGEWNALEAELMQDPEIANLFG